LGSGQILLLLTGWAVSPWPRIVYPDIDLHTAAAPATTLTFVLATLPLGMGLVVAVP
jgi:cytochrome bd-type quinol oxidase subunit 2